MPTKFFNGQIERFSSSEGLNEKWGFMHSINPGVPDYTHTHFKHLFRIVYDLLKINSGTVIITTKFFDIY